MTNKVTMPDHLEKIKPVGSVSITDGGLYLARLTNTGCKRVGSGDLLVTTDQAEAYADARVRQALEEAVMILKANAEACHSDTGIMLRANAEAIRALIQDPPCST